MGETKIEQWVLDDGRKAEKRITEQKNADGQSERVIELHVEEERPFRLQQRIIEKTKPFIYERKTEIVDSNGNVIDQKVESIDAKAERVTAQNIEDCDCNFTKQEIIDAVIEAIKSTKNNPAPKVNFNTRLQSLGVADDIGYKSDSSSLEKALVYGALVLTGLLGYVLFFM